ncbi:ARM repeat-containing protein [Rhizophagus irregularis]|uniref:ARM repeat-containing protein n=1 Tax=Rhizophagus irregularis TaxID=588596 RepID=A0A2N1P1M8_9GLOM|nr:ARM repeat-containing protein [Rhizophagus irregularis]
MNIDFTNNKDKFENAFTFESSSPPKQPPPPSPTAVHKSKYKRNSLPRNTEEARQRRIELDAQVRKRQREQLISAKRFKHHENYRDDDDADIEKLKSGLSNVNRDTRLSSLQDLSKFLVDPPDTLKQFVIEGNCIEILIVYIAAGPKEFVNKALTAVPYLISFLERENISLQDQAAWAIGNIAIESPEYRDLLRKNGVLIPLINLLDYKDVNLVQTACFALSNLARTPNAGLDEFFAGGIDKHLLRHLKTDESFEVVSEVAWVLTYITSDKDNKYTTQLLEEGLASLLVKHMRPLLGHGPLALPLIRTLGNIASGPDENTDILIQQSDFLPTMIEFIQSDCSRRPDVLDKVFNTGFIPILSIIATHSNFDIRKEAAYGLINIASHGAEFMRSLPHQELLPGFLEYIRSQDFDLIRLGLGYIEMLLTQVQNGKQLMESMQGIDALESVTLIEDQLLRNSASRLMDQYFEEISNEMQQIEEII